MMFKEMRMDDAKEIDVVATRQSLLYCPTTGLLFWRKRPASHFKNERSCKIWNSRFSGKRAGRIQVKDRGYKRRVVRFSERTLLEHRLAWAWMTGRQPPEEIDHINGDATDNRWSNLRASTRAQNSQNMAMPTTNTSGVSGVQWNRAAGRWVARVNFEGKTHYLGQFKDIDLAAMEVLEFRRDHGFSQRHGRDLSK